MIGKYQRLNNDVLIGAKTSINKGEIMFSSFSEFLVETSKLIIKTILAKYPCKKCLVQACCSKTCSDKQEYINLCGLNGINFQKFSAYSIIFSVSMIIFGIIKFIIAP